jgi:hypothetical protein
MLKGPKNRILPVPPHRNVACRWVGWGWNHHGQCKSTNASSRHCSACVCSPGDLDLAGSLLPGNLVNSPVSQERADEAEDEGIKHGSSRFSERKLSSHPSYQGNMEADQEAQPCRRAGEGGLQVQKQLQKLCALTAARCSSTTMDFAATGGRSRGLG